MIRSIPTEPLTASAFAPFGHVVSGDRDDVAPRPANQGTAARHDWLAPLENQRANARANVCVFRCAPRTAWPFEIELLEHHPRSTQLFVPMNATRYVVVVAPPDSRGGPDLSGVRAFVATGRQGVAYHPGAWHHPLLALDAETDFACVVFEVFGASDASRPHSDDCVVASLAPAARVIVTLS